jgi:DNA-binding NtrC family response regulator
MEKLSILVLDDEKRIREELVDFFNDNGYLTYNAGTPYEAEKIYRKHQIDIAIVDINLPEKDGLTVLQEIKEFDPDIEVLIITGQGSMEVAIEAMRYGAADFFNKPVRLSEVMNAIERTKRYIYLSRNYSQIRKNYDSLLEELFDNVGLRIIGKSQAILKVVEMIKLAAENPDLPVMITGESGTGKELIARTIHHLSPRKNGFFHAVNCAAIPENLFESEFFGYVKGAFTNALTNKPGWFEIADKGTLFLDEIGDMQPMMQAKLLRISEDGKVRRLGSNSDIRFNTRIMTATNQDIVQLLKEGKFRQDLYHRINTYKIFIPPLRERKEDIPLLIEQFVKAFAIKTNKPITGIETSLMDKLNRYHFPGNVRELKNMVERAVILCKGSKLQKKHFVFESLFPDDKGDNIYDQNSRFDLEDIERETIQRALKHTDNNKLQAAKLLNITWQTLERRLKKHNLTLIL